ncbi:uncharacterized protein ATNIH1004_009321 [Aspergillus tanneri]|uniref:Uncharacterized protein n=1 Tax=Aspergillus tanneri TaxID=1220188 RepID=A0A5M9MH44_9EURO|nr:uncharacterized protein ATNIH1004_009321 [Aspergillus tanneri]KAA8645106.1 hypothetical protein ATNIH1004_009321 [Aspergillus tanneri]
MAELHEANRDFQPKHETRFGLSVVKLDKATKKLNEKMGLSESELILRYGLHPVVVWWAHQELDSVVGMRMPAFEDLPSLPYIRALLAKFCAGDTQDPEVCGSEPLLSGYRRATFEHQYDFDPDRWIQRPHLPVNAFGLGRCACTRFYVDQNSVSIAIAHLLWAYNISHTYENGQKLEVDSWSLTQEIGVRPIPFKALFRVRGTKRQEIIEQTWTAAEKDTDILLERASYTFKISVSLWLLQSAKLTLM